MTGFKILLTGATGYIGGSVLSAILDSSDPNIQASKVSVLVRGGEARAKPFQDAGLNVIHFSGLDDEVAITRAASDHDVVIGTTLGYHTGSAVSILEGLAKRKAALTAGDESAPARLPCYIHLDGTSNLGDQPISGAYLESREFSDVKDNMYEYMRMRQTKDVYIQRTTSLSVIDTGKRLGVTTYTMMPPTIYGTGSGGRFGGNTLSVMIPLMMRSACQQGQAAMIGDGRGVRDQVHVLDLANLYVLLLGKLLAGDDKDVPSGERGIFFSVQGRYTWKEVAEGIAKAGYELGALRTKEVASWTLEKAAREWSGEVDGDFSDSEFMTELGLASNSITRGEHAAGWGWKPQRTEADWQRHFRDEFAQVLAEKR